MVWFKVDDGFWSHPKVVELSPEAVALWVRAGSYAAQHLTDGAVTLGTLRMLGAGRETADELVLSGLWDHVDTRTWAFHDWAEYQPASIATKERREELSRARSEAGKKGAEARWKQGDSKADGNLPSGEPSDADGKPMPPSRPGPDDFYSPSKSQSPTKRASVSTDAIEVPEMTRRLAAQKGIKSLRVVVDAIVRHTGLRVDAAGAFQVAADLLDKAKDWPDHPQPYVLSCIERTPLEVQQFIHERALEVA